MIDEYSTTTGGDLTLGDEWYGGPDEFALFVLSGVLDVIVLEQMLEDQPQRSIFELGNLRYEPWSGDLPWSSNTGQFPSFSFWNTTPIRWVSQKFYNDVSVGYQGARN